MKSIKCTWSKYKSSFIFKKYIVIHCNKKYVKQSLYNRLIYIKSHKDLVQLQQQLFLKFLSPMQARSAKQRNQLHGYPANRFNLKHAR